MALLTENKLKEELRKKAFREFYLFVEEDPLRPSYYTDQIFQSALPEGSRKDVFYGDELDVDELMEQVRTPSLWDPMRFLLVKQGERLSAKQWEALLPLLKEPFERSILLFQCAKADSRLKFFQAAAKAGDRVGLLKFEAASQGEWNLWLQSFLKAEGKDLEAEGRELLWEWTGGSLSELRHALAKAALFSGEAAQIRKEHIQAVGFRVAPEDIFQFVGLLLEGNRSRALIQLEKLLAQGEEPLALVGLLARQYRWLLSILTHRAEGKADAAISSAAGIFPSAGRVLFPASRRLGSKKVMRGLAALAEADYGLKSSRLPKDQLLTGLVLSLTE